MTVENHCSEETNTVRSDRTEGMVFHLHTAINRVIAACLLAEILLVLLDYLIAFRRLIPSGLIGKIFDLEREDNLPTWFSSTQAVFVGLTLLVIFYLMRRKGATRMDQLGWMVLGLFFIYMGIDDTAHLHERIGTALGRFFSQEIAHLPGPLKYLVELTTYSPRSSLGFSGGA